MKKKTILLFATALGLGYAPIASGTFGTLLGIPILLATAWLDNLWRAVAAVIFALLAIPICDVAEKHFGKKDDRRIVADEYLTYPLCLIWLPWVEAPWLLAMAFVTHRLFDIIKPPPARSSQRIGGGLGIAIDDIISSLYALAANHILWWAYCRYLTAL